MYRELSKLVVYKNIDSDSVLFNLGRIFKTFKENNYDKECLIEEIYSQIHRILEISTKYAFDTNLWHNYLAFLLATTENPFSMTCEKVGAKDGSVNSFAKGDFKIFKNLFDYDFSEIEKTLEINCFSIILNYKSIEKSEHRYNKSVSEKVKQLSFEIENAKDENQIFEIVTTFYKLFGVGKFGLNKAFRIVNESINADVELVPITNTVEVHLSDLVGYELQKKKLVDNTVAFIDGKKANNVLLFGDSGTGKTTSINAILNEFYGQGLRIIEIYKHQFKDLSAVISKIKNRNYKFIIYMDDLSFEEFETDYKYLKAVIEGGMEIIPDNVLIYATSNRRHLIKETWNDRSDMETTREIHRSDTMEEKLSLVNRFGISINYSKPTRAEYHKIVMFLAKRHPEIKLGDKELIFQANQWEMKNGGISGRTAQQFITYLAGNPK